MTCSKQFVVTLTVQSGQNATESVQTVSLHSATDAAGNTYALLDTLDISLAKSAIRLDYPLTYTRNYNNKPYELVLTRDTGGNSFNWLTNPCVDDPTRDGSCGWVLAQDGSRVPSSNGYCCECNLAEYLSGASVNSRAGLECSLFNSANSQSAHCLRMDPLWYSAYTVGAPAVDYSIDVVFRRCSGVGSPASVAAGLFNLTSASDGSNASTTSPTATPSAAAMVCQVDLVTIGPTLPGACKVFAPVGNAPSATSGCDAWVSLEGDFAAYQSPPDFSSKLLMIPTECDSWVLCGNRTIDSTLHWMLVDVASTTTGSACDKVGVSYSGFNAQGSRCDQPVQVGGGDNLHVL